VGLLRPLFGRFLACQRGLRWYLELGFAASDWGNDVRIIGFNGTPSVLGWAGRLGALVPGVIHPAGALLAQLVLLGLACTESVMVYVFVGIENRTIWI
jgi:hypothetical protein